MQLSAQFKLEKETKGTFRYAFYLFQNPHAPFHCKMLLLHGKIPSSSFQILPQNSPSLWIKKPKAGQVRRDSLIDMCTGTRYIAS